MAGVVTVGKVMWTRGQGLRVKDVVAGAMAGWLSCSGAWAETVTTAQVGDVTSYLMTTATCGEAIDAIQAAGSDTSTPDQVIMMLALITFQYGYASGRGISQEDAMMEILTRCNDDPAAPFAGFPE
jgi:hypothetical protein